MLLGCTTPDRDAAWECLGTIPDISPEMLDAGSLAVDPPDVLWLHGPGAPLDGVREWLERGGRMLATLEAAAVPARLGLERVSPDERIRGTWQEKDAVRGLAAFGAHPLFAGMGQGAFTWAPAVGETFSWLVYRSTRPNSAAVIAVERHSRELNPERVVAWEYQVGDGGILCIGAFVHPGASSRRFSRHLAALLANAIAGDAIPHRDRAVPVATWPEPGRYAQRNTAVPVPEISPLEGPWIPSSSDLVLEGDYDGPRPWTLAGRRMLLTGTEETGLVEAWSHPFRLMHQVDLQINGTAPVPQSVRVAPDQVSRTFRAGALSGEERWTTGLERPVLIWEIESSPMAAIRAAWSVDLRRMWPYPDGACGDLRWNLSEDGTRLWIGAAGASLQIVFLVQGGRLLPPEGIASAAPRVEVRVAGQGSLRIVAVAGVDSDDLAASVRAVARKQFDGLQRQRAQHAEQVRAYGVAIETPDPDLARAFEWAKVRTDSFVADTPGLGRSLLAGYAASRPGEGDGRPGLAWYFGPDACRTALAQLAAGQREPVRDVIRFLSRHQDVTGQVLSQYSTSGLAQFDDAESTPLYLLLVARYAAWTGDLDFLGKQWDRVERAWRFCLEAECDLSGMDELAPVADALGRGEMADRLRQRGDGSGPAPGRARLASMAGATFSTPWGVRTLAADDPRFDPADAYHGAVSPWLTGRASLAEWRAGDYAAALDHLLINARIYRDRQRGAYDQLLHGLAYRGAGGCPDSATSAAMVISPVIEGLWGIVPSALDDEVAIAPWLPPDWPRMSLRRLRVGRTVLDLEVRRRPAQLAVRIARSFGPGILVTLSPRLDREPESVAVDDVVMAGASVRFQVRDRHEAIFTL